MFSVHHKCPNCNKDGNFTFQFFTHYLEEKPPRQGDLRQPKVNFSSSGDTVKAYTVSSCSYCHAPLLLIYRMRLEVMRAIQTAIEERKHIYTGAQPELVASYPQVKTPLISEYYPASIIQPFRDVQEMLTLRMSPAFIITACRSILEVLLKQELQVSGKNLMQCIDQARASGLITQAMAEWAHRVRIEGNEAVHELSANAIEAEELVEFIKIFLELTFILPKRIEAAKH